MTITVKKNMWRKHFQTNKTIKTKDRAPVTTERKPMIKTFHQEAPLKSYSNNSLTEFQRLWSGRPKKYTEDSGQEENKEKHRLGPGSTKARSIKYTGDSHLDENEKEYLLGPARKILLADLIWTKTIQDKKCWILSNKI